MSAVEQPPECRCQGRQQGAVGLAQGSQQAGQAEANEAEQPGGARSAEFQPAPCRVPAQQPDQYEQRRQHGVPLHHVQGGRDPQRVQGPEQGGEHGRALAVVDAQAGAG